MQLDLSGSHEPLNLNIDFEKGEGLPPQKKKKKKFKRSEVQRLEPRQDQSMIQTPEVDSHVINIGSL